MNLRKNKVVVGIFIILIITLIMLYYYHVYDMALESMPPTIENFEDLRIFNASTMNEAVRYPYLNKWTYDRSKDWYAIKQNDFSIKMKDMGFRQYTNITISFFFKIMAGYGNWRNIFHFTQHEVDGFAMGQRNPAVWVSPNQLHLHIRFSADDNGNNGIDTHSGAPPIELNKPYLITMVFNNKNYSCYMNKTKWADKTYGNFAKRNGDTTMWIGSPWYDAQNVLISNYTVYDGALTATDVENMVNIAEIDPSLKKLQNACNV